ncbi:MAG TPA: HAD family phosphatase [Clostridia bacterium]|nr:HAD family phosphatase [Clostridia bacterium]
MKCRVINNWQVKGIIFDLDGVLIDSVGVWEKVDRDFLTKRDIPVPENLAEEIKSLHFRDVAIYFQENFQIPESIEEIMAEWNEMVYDEYARKITLKPGVKNYLNYLKSRDLKIGLATSNNRNLTKAVLKNNGIKDNFEVITTGEDVERDKNFPDIYLQCAQELEIEPEECIVFEDILAGVLSAKMAGMRVVGVYDQHSRNEWTEIKENADLWIKNFSELIIREYEAPAL